MRSRCGDRDVPRRIGRLICVEKVPPCLPRGCVCLPDTRFFAMPVLSADDLQFFEDNGYVVAKGAVSREQALATAAEVSANVAICLLPVR